MAPVNPRPMWARNISVAAVCNFPMVNIFKHWVPDRSDYPVAWIRILIESIGNNRGYQIAATLVRESHREIRDTPNLLKWKEPRLMRPPRPIL